MITNNQPAKKGSLNSLADGTFHNFTLLTHSLTTNVQNLKERAQFYEDGVNELKCRAIKRGKGVGCSIDSADIALEGFAVPVCINGFKKPYCGCEGTYIAQSCPYGYNSLSQCRSSNIIKCCYERCEASLDLVIVLDSSGNIF